MKVGQGGRLFVCNRGLLVGQCTQDYKCLYSGYDLCLLKFDLSILTPLPRKVGQAPGICCTHVSYTHNPNLVTAGQQIAEIMQIFYDDPKKQ